MKMKARGVTKSREMTAVRKAEICARCVFRLLLAPLLEWPQLLRSSGSLQCLGQVSVARARAGLPYLLVVVDKLVRLSPYYLQELGDFMQLLKRLGIDASEIAMQHRQVHIICLYCGQHVSLTVHRANIKHKLTPNRSNPP